MSLNSVISAVNDFKFTFIFYFLLILFVYLNRKKFDTIGKFIYLYRTKVGIKLMDQIASKSREVMKFLGYAGIFVGFIGMILSFIIVFTLTYKLLLNVPGSSGASPVIPGLPIAGTGMIFPLVTGWIAIFIIIAVHEFSHGIMARAYNIKVNHSGIAFFGPILGAFVEPDEKNLTKQKDFIQHSVFSAGPFSNILLTLFAIGIIFFILIPIVNVLITTSGVIISPQPGFPAEKAGITNNTIITKINDIEISNVEEFQKIMIDTSPNQRISLNSKNKTFFVITTGHPEKPEQSYLGVFVLGNDSKLKNQNFFNAALLSFVQWFLELLSWVAFLSINIGLLNLLPIFLTDGARMSKVLIYRLFKDRKQCMSIWLGINWIALFSLLILVFLPLLRWINDKLSVILLSLLA